MKLVEPLTTELRTQNFENMVLFYEDELRALIKGRPVSELFNYSSKRVLKRLGILYFFHPGYIYKNRLRVSDKALALLDIVKK